MATKPTKRKATAPTDAEMIAAIGTSLYGTEWTARIATDLNLSKDVVRDLRRNHATLFPDHVAQLKTALEERRAQIATTLKMIAAWEKASA